MQRVRKSIFFALCYFKCWLVEERVIGQTAADRLLGKAGGMHTKGMIIFLHIGKGRNQRTVAGMGRK